MIYFVYEKVLDYQLQRMFEHAKTFEKKDGIAKVGDWGITIKTLIEKRLAIEDSGQMGIPFVCSR